MKHLTDHDLELYYLGMAGGREMVRIEKHLFGCTECVKRAYEAQNYVDTMRRAIIQGDFDLEWLERNSGKG